MSDMRGAEDIGAYCRSVEDHLTRVNGGHLVRVVGPGFDLVRQWAQEGIPLSVVFRGIDLKAERHRGGQSKRPLRIEFCEGDVREVFDHWRRAIGLMTSERAAGGDDGDAPAPESAEPARRPLGRHLDRAIDRLSRTAGRLELPSDLRETADRILQELAAMRELSKRIRGQAREEADARLSLLGAELTAAARRNAAAGLCEELERDAARELAPYRARLGAEGWQRSIDLTVDRLLRDRFDLPVLEP